MRSRRVRRAGGGVLPLAQPAEGRIVYTKAQHSIGRGSSYNLDLNHDGITDFTISVTYHCPQTCVSAVLARPAKGTGGVEGHHSRNGSDWAYALKAGVRIGPKRPFSAKYLVFAVSGGCSGEGAGSYWCNVTDRYLGLSFKINGQIH